MRSWCSFLIALALLALGWWRGGPSPGWAQLTDHSASELAQSASPQDNGAPRSMQPSEVLALLYKIYTVNFRIGDVTGALPIDQWRLSDENRASLRQKTDSLRSSVANLEKVRSDFYNHPGDSALAQGTASALQTLPAQ